MELEEGKLLLEERAQLNEYAGREVHADGVEAGAARYQFGGAESCGGSHHHKGRSDHRQRLAQEIRGPACGNRRYGRLPDHRRKAARWYDVRYARAVLSSGQDRPVYRGDHIRGAGQGARLLNAPFVKYITTGKCWVTLKWAQSLDGKVAWADQSAEQRWISNGQSRRDVHKLRRRAQGILVGINTVIADDPLLTAIPSKGRKATRIVMDNFLRIPLGCQLVETAAKSPVVIFTRRESARQNPQLAQELTGKGVELLAYPDTQGGSNLHFLLDELSTRGVTQLLVEGGPSILTSFLKEDLADEIIVYVAPKILGSRGSAGITGPMAALSQAVGLQNVDVTNFGDDARLSGLTEKAIREISNPPSRNTDLCAASETVYG